MSNYISDNILFVHVNASLFNFFKENIFPILHCTDQSLSFSFLQITYTKGRQELVLIFLCGRKTSRLNCTNLNLPQIP